MQGLITFLKFTQLISDKARAISQVYVSQLLFYMISSIANLSDLESGEMSHKCGKMPYILSGIAVMVQGEWENTLCDFCLKGSQERCSWHLKEVKSWDAGFCSDPF